MVVFAWQIKVLLIRIVPGSPAAEAGQTGDVIQSINNQPVNKQRKFNGWWSSTVVASYKCKYNTQSAFCTSSSTA